MQEHQMAITLTVLGLLVLGMLQEKIGAEIVMLMAMLVLVMTGVLPASDAVRGFSDSAVITIGALFVIGMGLRTTGAMEVLGRWLLGRPS
jgi:di/tricarboxylate transporter